MSDRLNANLRIGQMKDVKRWYPQDIRTRHGADVEAQYVLASDYDAMRARVAEQAAVIERLEKDALARKCKMPKYMHDTTGAKDALIAFASLVASVERERIVMKLALNKFRLAAPYAAFDNKAWDEVCDGIDIDALWDRYSVRGTKSE